MDLLNSLLILKPVNVLRMKSSFRIAKNVLKELQEKEKTETKKILEYRDKLLKPVKDFFDSLYDYQSLLKPLVVKILLEDENQTIKDKAEEYLFLQFFDVSKEKALTFFHDTLVTKEMLLKACEEFEIMFGVVTSNLSEEVIQKEKEILAKIKVKKLSQKQNDKSQLNKSPAQKRRHG